MAEEKDKPDRARWERWQANPCAFVEEALVNYETGRPFELLPAERAFMEHSWRVGENGRLLYPMQCYGAIKKSGKTAFAGMHVLTTTLLFGGSYPEAIVCSNDFEQAQGRVFEAVRRIVECTPWLKRQSKVTQDKVVFPGINGTIKAIPSDYASAAGGNQAIGVFDELWGYTSERARRLWDEMVPPPTRRISLRLVTTYAGFEGESVLLEELYKRGMALPEIGKDLRAGDGMLFFWSHEPIASWQTAEWIAEMRRSLRPNQFLRMIENRFVSAESSFLEMGQWDQCVRPELRPSMERLPIWVGLDASTKHDSTALVAVTFDKRTQVVRLIAHRVFTPDVLDPIDFEGTIEATLLDWRKRYVLRQVLFDPFQMAAVSQRLVKGHVPMEEYPQTVPNLTAATSNLFDLIQSRCLALYPDAGMRLAASRAVIVESSRGWRLDKLKQAHKIDVIVALGMACLAAVRGQEQPPYDLFNPGLFSDDPVEEEKPPPPTRAERDHAELLARYGAPVSLGPRVADLPGHVREGLERARADVARTRHLPP